MIIKLICIAQHKVSEWWPRIGEMATEAMLTSQGKYTGEDMFSCAALRKVQFWVGIDEEDDIKLFGITQIIDFPSNRVCEVLCVTGKQKELWEDKIADLEAWAKHNNCNLMELYARPGWERPMKKQGYERTHTILNKKLGE